MTDTLTDFSGVRDFTEIPTQPGESRTCTDKSMLDYGHASLTMEELLFWCREVIRYLELTRLSIGLTEEEQRLLNGLKAAIKRIGNSNNRSPE